MPSYDPYNPQNYTPLMTSDDDAMAQVLRSQWQDYLNYYQPISQRLMDMTSYNNPALVTDTVNRSAIDVNRAFDAGGESQQRSYARFGTSPTEGQQQYLDRQNNMDRSSAVVDAANNIRLRIADRNRQIAAGGIPNVTSAAIRTSVGSSG